MLCVPCTAFGPDQAPDAVHVTAFNADHDSVALPPLVTALGPTLKVTDGAAALIETVADWLALPPEFEQVKV